MAKGARHHQFPGTVIMFLPFSELAKTVGQQVLGEM